MSSRPFGKPWACVTLNVDAGERCGVAIYNQGVYYDSDHGDGYDSAWIDTWINNAVYLANFVRQPPLPLILILENAPRGGMPYRGTKRNALGAASVLGCRKLWKRAWKKSPQTVTRYAVDVYPATWRSLVIGGIKDPHPRERVRAAIEKYGNAAKQCDMQQDESAAICIGVWSSMALAVLEVLPQRVRLACAS